MGIVESAYSAAQARLRPILMTVLTMIFGMLPLMFASGAGANGNSSLGTGVVGGMAVGTVGITVRRAGSSTSFSNTCKKKSVRPMEVETDMQVALEKQKSQTERDGLNNENK